MSQKSKSFETSLARLTEIVNQLEKGDVPLEKSMKLFQEGTELVRACTKLLDEAELEIVKLTRGADGAVTEEAFSNENAE